jgi:hypothetical protein
MVAVYLDGCSNVIVVVGGDTNNGGYQQRRKLRIKWIR